jgi:hypothetical protein
VGLPGAIHPFVDVLLAAGVGAHAKYKAGQCEQYPVHDGSFPEKDDAELILHHAALCFA